VPAQEYFRKERRSGNPGILMEAWWNALVRGRDLGYLQALSTISRDSIAGLVWQQRLVMRRNSTIQAVDWSVCLFGWMGVAAGG
jgi:hypothetical protein